MKLIIDVDEKLVCEGFEHNFTEEERNTLIRAIGNGTPLPKGHGRIGDLDAVMNDINRSIEEMTNLGIAVDGEYLWAKLNNAIDNAQIIIPAESEEK